MSNLNSSFLYSDLLGINPYGSVELLTNPNLAGASIRWVHCLTVDSDCSFLQSGDFALLCISDSTQIDKLLATLTKIKRVSSSGVLLVMHPSICTQAVRDAIINCCNNIILPVLLTTDTNSPSSLCKYLCQHITSNERFHNLQEQIISNLLTQDPLDEQATLNQLLQLGFDVKGEYLCAVVRASSEHSAESETLKRVLNEARLTISRSISGFSCSCVLDNQLIIIMPVTVAGQRADDFLSPILYALMEQHSNISLQAGCGTHWQNISQFRHSSEIASKLSRLPHRRLALALDRMVIFRLLCQFDDPKELLEIYLFVLGPLLEYDKNNNTQLLKCLKAFLENDQSMKASAEELYLHINTMRNRIEKIEELLGHDIRNTRWHLFRYYFAFFIEDYLHANSTVLDAYPSHSSMTHRVVPDSNFSFKITSHLFQDSI